MYFCCGNLCQKVCLIAINLLFNRPIQTTLFVVDKRFLPGGYWTLSLYLDHKFLTTHTNAWRTFIFWGGTFNVVLYIYISHVHKHTHTRTHTYIQSHSPIALLLFCTYDSRSESTTLSTAIPKDETKSTLAQDDENNSDQCAVKVKCTSKSSPESLSSPSPPSDIAITPTNAKMYRCRFKAKSDHAKYEKNKWTKSNA